MPRRLRKRKAPRASIFYFKPVKKVARRRAPKVVVLPERCHWCGAQAGYHTEYDGWPRCNVCDGC
jgi:hypothetical protein